VAYRLTRAAAEDIRHVYREGKRLFGVRQADLYHLFLESIFEMLAQNPEAAGERTEISPPVRIHPSGAHLVVYLKTEDGNVLVLRVRHARENWIS
jgi:toxin ParE1/3/4